MSEGTIVDLERVVAEVDGLWQDRTAWLDRGTGRVLVLARGNAGDGFVRLPGVQELELVENFLSSLGDEGNAHHLARAYCGPTRGRAERFEAALARAGLRGAWRDYRRAAVRRQVVRHLQTAGIRFR